MRSHGFLVVADTFADHVGADQSRYTGVDMHYGTTGEIERALLEQPARGRRGFISRRRISESVRAGPVPDHMRDRQIGESKPQRHEQQHRREFDPLRKRTHDQAGGDGGEGQLEGDVNVLRNHHALAEGRRGRVGVHPGQEQTREAAEKGVTLGEGDAIAVEHPQHADQAKRDEHLHQHREHVLGAHQAAVEKRESRDGHQNHQHCGNDHPRSVALVGHRRRRRRSRRCGRGRNCGRGCCC